MPEPWIEGTIGREVEPRPGFAEELAADLAAGWRGESPAVPVTIEPRRHTGHRRPSSWWLVAAAALVVAVVGVSVRARSAPQPSGRTPTSLVGVPAPTTAPSTAAPSTTVAAGPTTVLTVPATAPAVTAAPSSTAVPIPTTTPAPDPNHPDGFDPPCTESVSATAPGGPAVEDTSLERFGPLGTSPMMSITLPIGWSGGQPLPSAVEVTRIPGGTLVAAQSSDFGFTDSMLAAVGDDGATRWVRCFADRAGLVVAAPAATSPQTALVQFAHDPGSGAMWTGTWRIVDLADGIVRADLAEVLRAANIDPAPFDNNQLPLAVDDDEVVLGPGEETIVDVDRDRLLRFDLATLTPTLVPFPAAADGQGMVQLRFGYNAGGALALLASQPGQPPVQAALVDGAWSTAPNDLLAYDGIRADYPSEGGFDAVLEGRDGHGDVVWRNAELTVGDPGEGFRGAVDGDISVVAACFGGYDELTGCPDQGIAGVRNQDGAVLWRLPERRGVVAVGDGHALIVGPVGPLPDGTTGVSGWSMIDTATGHDIPGQRWTDPSTFQVECCGGDAAVVRSGAIVTAIDDGRLTVWFPASAAPANARTALP